MMSAEVTHRYCDVERRMVQVVPPWHLRAMLNEDGETYERPADFTDDDEWDVGDGQDGGDQ